MIDGFFTGEICQGLLDEFPRFRDENALNELGKVGQKAVREDIPRLGESYARVDDSSSRWRSRRRPRPACASAAPRPSIPAAQASSETSGTWATS